MIRGKDTSCRGITNKLANPSQWLLLSTLEKDTSLNTDKCLRLLRYMSTLAKHMKNLNIHVDRAKLDDILGTLVKAAVLCGQMRPNIFLRFPVLFNDADMKDLEYQLVHSSGQALPTVLDRVPIVPCPLQGLYLPFAVGIEEAQNKVIDLLDLKYSFYQVVVIYGIGWIGKMTLASAVFNRLDLDLKDMQEEILCDLFKENLKLNNCTYGQEKLLEAFRKFVSLFVYR